MKILLCVLPLIITASAASLPSTITDVTVYPDRARVTRTAETKLEAGSSTVEIPGLPIGLEDSSVRVELDNLPDTVVESLEVRPVEPGRTEVDARPFEAEILALEDKIRAVGDDRSELQRQREYLDNLRNKVGEAITQTKNANVVPATEVKAHYALYTKESSDLANRARTLDITQREVQKQLDEKRRKLNTLRQGEPVTTKKAVIVLRGDKTIQGKLRLIYVMNNASWQPLYDIRRAPDSSEAQLAYYANVAQNTGESWSNVRLTLSTARPNRGAGLPEAPLWVVSMGQDFGNAALDVASSAPRQERMDSSRGYKLNLIQNNNSVGNNGFNVQIAEEDAKEGSLGKLKDNLLAEITSLGSTAIFKVPAAASIPSDGQPRRSTIALQTLKGSAEFVANPKLINSAFLKARMKNNSPLTLLPGEVSLFVGDDFVGKSGLPLVMPGAGFDLFLGADDGLKISRKESKKRDDTSGVLHKTRKQLREYTVIVTNNRATSSKLVLKENLPVSQQSGLTVRPDWQGVVPTKFNADNGVAEWSLELKPQESRTVRYAFEVETEPGVNVAGL